MAAKTEASNVTVELPAEVASKMADVREIVWNEARFGLSQQDAKAILGKVDELEEAIKAALVPARGL